MRDSLFRAAQKGGYFPSEEPVGQKQDRLLTRKCFEDSFVPLPMEIINPTSEPALILWPYPKGTADCIDRANCADDFIRTFPEYRVITDFSFEQDNLCRLKNSEENIIIFAPFELIRDGLSIDDEGFIRFWERRCGSVLNELIIGYLVRYGLIKLNPDSFKPARQDNRDFTIRTQILNGSTYGIFKGLQASHFQQYCRNVQGLASMRFEIPKDENQLAGALTRQLQNNRGVVVRPFCASQGSGIVFVDTQQMAHESAEAISREVIGKISAAMERKYGSVSAFPLTVCPFEESVLIGGCVSDLRIFVLYDHQDKGLRAIPGMVRRAQVPIQCRDILDSDCAMTNLNAPQASDGLTLPRIFALTAQDTLKQLQLNEESLIKLCHHACQIWASAFSNENHFFMDQAVRQFCYGSVDFLIRGVDGAAIPIEMNGANVGSHPTVHPEYIDAFGKATTGALVNVGLGRMNHFSGIQCRR